MRAVHVIDQHGLSLKEPTYVGIGFYILEIVGVTTAFLLSGVTRLGWILAVGVAAGPLIGYSLSRRAAGLHRMCRQLG